MGQKVCGFLSRPSRTIEDEPLPLAKEATPGRTPRGGVVSPRRGPAGSADSDGFPPLPLVTPPKVTNAKSDGVSEVTTSVGGEEDGEEEAQEKGKGKGKGRNRKRNKGKGKGKGKGKAND
jgi:hypothetical protein